MNTIFPSFIAFLRVTKLSIFDFSLSQSLAKPPKEITIG
jgi:hypothetical protein